MITDHETSNKMPERGVTSFAEGQNCHCSCSSCGVRRVLSRSFPPYYTQSSCPCRRDESGLTTSTGFISDKNIDSEISVKTDTDSGFCCSTRTGVVTESTTNSAEIPCVCSDCEPCPDTPCAIWQPDEDGDTSLHVAVIHGNIRAVMYILQQPGMVRWLNHQNNLRQTALHLSVLSRHLLITKLLMQQGVDPQIRDRRGNTALHLACKLGDVESVDVLTSAPLAAGISGGLCVNLRNYDGLTCLHLAASSGHLDVVRYLLRADHVTADVNMADGCSGRTLLHNAVETRDMGLLCYLLQCRYETELDLEACTYSGHTALSLALGIGHHDIVEFLLLAGASSVIPPTVQCDSESDSDSDNSISMDTDDDDGMEYDDFLIAGRQVYL